MKRQLLPGCFRIRSQHLKHGLQPEPGGGERLEHAIVQVAGETEAFRHRGQLLKTDGAVEAGDNRHLKLHAP